MFPNLKPEIAIVTNIKHIFTNKKRFGNEK